MKILGISCYYHDSAAVALEDRVVRFAMHEERLSRRKHDSGFPRLALARALEFCGWDIREVDRIAFYERPRLKLQRLRKQVLLDWPRSFELFSRHLPAFEAGKLDISRVIRRELGYSGDIIYYDHHYSHAASAFYTSPFEKALILTIDGVGEWDCIGLFEGKGNSIRKLASIRYPDSLGLFYSVFTRYLGFRVNSGEFKVMGMACYGKPLYLERLLSEVIRLRPDGSFRLNMDCFNFSSDISHWTPRLERILGICPRVKEGPVGQEHFDLAASVQAALEEAVVHLLRHIFARYGKSNLCLCGGVALNCTMNSRIIGEFGVIPFIHPAAGDAGGAFGAAVSAAVEECSQPARVAFRPYLGMSHVAEGIREVLRRRNVPFTVEQDAPLRIADLLARGRIVAVLQGRDEWGPRALGNRSILADAGTRSMQDHLNAKIKFREQFRPFAPIIMREHFADYFDTLGMDEAPYMLFTHKVKQPQALPAATHVDNTGRVQTVSREQNPRIHRTLCEFLRLTGRPVFINTSFNLRGEPIVSSPDDALNTFFNSGIDDLFVEDHHVSKEQI